MAGEIDTLEEQLLEFVDEMEGEIAELVSRCGLDTSPEVMRVVVAIAAGTLRRADDRGMIRELFGSAAPVRSDLAVFAQQVMGLIDRDRNPRLAAKCVDFVWGLGLNGGKSQTEIATEEGINKATVSKKCIQLRTRFGRPPARGMKTDNARESYRLSRTGKRRPPRVWAFAKSFFGGLGAASV